MKIYVINLETAEERRRHLVRLLDEYRLEYDLIKAVDGRIFSSEELERVCDMDSVRRRPEKLTPGAIGCALSHFDVYKKMLAENLDMALVLEDDVVPPPNLMEILELIEKHIHAGEVVLLHCFQLLPDVPVLSRRDATPLDERYSLLHPFEIPRGAAAYVVTRDAARALSEARFPIKVEADDWAYFHETGAIKSLRCVYPLPVRTTYVESQIQPPYRQSQKEPIQYRIAKFIYNNEIPVFYRMLMNYRAARNESQPFQPIELVDAPSPFYKEAN